MGDLLSTLSNQNHNSTPPTNPTTPSSDPPQTHSSPPQTAPTHQPKTQEESSDPPKAGPIQALENDAVSEEAEENKQNEGDEEEEGECGFCLYMKGGGCREVFTEWERCVIEAEMKNEDIVEKCHIVSKALKECMEAHSDYYGPILQAEAETLDGEKEGNEEGKEEGEGREGGLEPVPESVATIQVEEGKDSTGAEGKQGS